MRVYASSPFVCKRLDHNLQHLFICTLQGFHDVTSVFLLVLEDDHIAFALAEVISRDYISDFMNCDFEVVGRSMKMLFVIIKASDSVLHRFLMSAEMEPFFATSWLLTWFSHDLQYISDAARLFDAILCSHPLFIYYLCAAVSTNLFFSVIIYMLFEREFAGHYVLCTSYYMFIVYLFPSVCDSLEE